MALLLWQSIKCDEIKLICQDIQVGRAAAAAAAADDDDDDDDDGVCGGSMTCMVQEFEIAYACMRTSIAS
jgi:hypothetical protein